MIGGSEEEVAEEVGAGTTVYAGLRAGFSEGRWQAYAYLLFILLYMPCVAAFAAMTKEMGPRYSVLSMVYLWVVSWSVATLFYQIAVAGDPLWIVVSLLLLGLMVFVFWAIGRWVRPMETWEKRRLSTATQTSTPTSTPTC